MILGPLGEGGSPFVSGEGRIGSTLSPFDGSS